MQSDPPQGDPRLQRTNPGPKITTDLIDPCIISIETTLPGEIPMLVHLWAASCREVRAAGTEPRWELTDIVILKCLYHKRHPKGAPTWSYRIQREKLLSVACFNASGSTRFSNFSGLYDYIPEQIYQWHIRYIDRATDKMLRKVMKWHPDRPERLAPVLLTHSGVGWPSILQAADSSAAANAAETKRRAGRPSLVRRLISSVFKKKKQPVHA